jgi:hypothetical protein
MKGPINGANFLGGLPLEKFQGLLAKAKEPSDDERAYALFVKTCGELRAAGLSVDEITDRIARRSTYHAGFVTAAIKRYARNEGIDGDSFYRHGLRRPPRRMKPGKRADEE